MGFRGARTAGLARASTVQSMSISASRSRLAAALKAACRVRSARSVRREEPPDIPPEVMASERRLLSVARSVAATSAEARNAAFRAITPEMIGRVRRIAARSASI